MALPRSTLATVCGAAALLVVAVVGTPARAQTAPPMASRADAGATALDLTVFGQRVVVGESTAGTATATPVARARGVGFLLAETAQGESVAESTAEGQSTGGPDPTCSELSLPDEVPLLDLATACSTAAASITAGAPAAQAAAELVSLSVDPMEVADLAAPLEPGLEDGLAQVFTGLAPLFEATDEGGADLEATLQQVVDGITDGGDLLTVELGPTSATIATDATGVTSTASAQGAVVGLLERSALGLDPVLTIEVGSSSAEVVADGTSGQATPSSSPALVRVRIADDVAALLPAGVPNPVEVAPGQTVDIPLPAPLTSRIVAAHGASAATDDGGQHAEASAVRLELLTGLPEGGIGLDLATAAAEVAFAAPAQQPAPPATAPPGPTALARTGGDVSPLLPMALGGASIAAAVAAWRGRRLT